VFLAGNGNLVACPPGITPGVPADAAAHGTTMGSAFHITSSVPVVAYDIFPFGGGSAAATSATLLLPTSAWDTNYIAVDAFRKDVFVAAGTALHRRRRQGGRHHRDDQPERGHPGRRRRGRAPGRDSP
jgi:hypothetical protein